MLGIHKGYEGLLDTSKIIQLNRDSVRGITHIGGTILGTTNKNSPFDYPMKLPNGEMTRVDRSDEVIESFRRLRIDALIAIGGDGTMKIASRFADKGLPIVGVPKTIDNDLSGTMVTFGFDTAVMVATEAHRPAAHDRRGARAGDGGRGHGPLRGLDRPALGRRVDGADVILIPEIPFDFDVVCDTINDREARGRRFSMVVVAEGATPIGGQVMVKNREEGREVQLGGIAEMVAREISARTGKETRTVVLGHLQRGGAPTTTDRLLALRFGAAAVRMVEQRQFSHMVALDPPNVQAVPLKVATSRMKSVPLDSDIVLTARDLGISFGDPPS